MKKTIKRLLPVLVVALVLVAAFAVTAFATDEAGQFPGKVTLLDMSQSGVEVSGYSDIDGNPAWTQVASYSKEKTLAYNPANFYWGWNFYAYYNSTTKTLVFMPHGGNVMSARNDSTVQPGEFDISDTTNINPLYYGEKWTNAGKYSYYAHSFEIWLDEYGAEVEHVEFRPYKANTTYKPVIAQEFGLNVANDLVNVKTVKMTANFNIRSASAAKGNVNQLFANKPQLTTVQLGTFAKTGRFAAETPVNAVALTEGPTDTDARFGLSGAIFQGCSSITRVILLTNSRNFDGLRNNMFNGCTSLKMVYIGGTMSESYQVGTDAFKGCSDVTVYVDDVSVATALSAAGVSLKTHEDYDDYLAEIVDALTKELPKENAPIVANGILAKIADNKTTGDAVAIRFKFTWNATATTEMGTPVKVGVVACSEFYYNSLGLESEIEKLVVLLADSNEAKVKKHDVAIYKNGEYTLNGSFLADGTDVEKGVYSYAYTLFGIPAANYDDEIYAATYIQWADGTYSVVSNNYDDPETTDSKKNTISLYDVTLGLFKNGLINSEKVADEYLWNVLKPYAGSNYYKTTGTSATHGRNLEYYFLPDNLKGGYVLAYKATTKYNDDNVTLMGSVIPHNVNSDYSAYKKFGTLYGQTNTVVIDHGVTAFGGARVFGGGFTTDTSAMNSSIKTVVYPSDMTTVGEVTTSNNGSHAFHCTIGISNVIWCHTDEDGNYVEHMTDVVWNEYCTDKTALWDLRGWGVPIISGNINASSAIKNIVLPKGTNAFTKGNAAVWAES